MVLVPSRTRRVTERREGAAALEGAIVYPVLVVLLLMVVVGGLGVFRAQQVACLAREAARYLSVRSGDYASDTGNTPPTQQQVLDQVVAPLAVGMNTGNLSVQIQWIDGIKGTVTDWDSSSQATWSTDNNGNQVNNRVRVTVTYRWFPEMFLAGPLALQSVQEVALLY
jgi:Flp pilus assembly protein TadG